MNKLITIEEAISKIKDGMVIMVGGFINGGVPKRILKALSESNIKDLTIITNDSGFPGVGVGQLIAKKQVSKLICSHIGTNSDTIQQFNAGELVVDFVPQGTLAERIRAAGGGLGGILTPTGIGTIVAEGKQIINVNGKDYLLEIPLKADMALLSAAKGDKTGNLYYLGTARNFNPVMATSADVVIAEVGELLEKGDFEPQDVHTPGIFVDFLVH